MNTLPSLFQSSVLLSSFLGILFAFILVMIAGVHITGAKPEGIAKATGCYIMKAFGLLLLSLSTVQITYAFITLRVPAVQSILGLVLLLVIGIGIIIHESRVIAEIDTASRSVPSTIFSYASKVIGALIAIVSCLSLMMTFILGRSVAGWEMSATLLLLGCVLSLTSSIHAEGRMMKSTKKKR